jgi:hypothetical protein
VKINTSITGGGEDFVWGTNEWDLIVISYGSPPEIAAEVRAALRPGGFILVEAVHYDSTANHSIHAGVVFKNNELLELWEGFRVWQYEDVEAPADFEPQDDRMRVVQLLAQKPIE